MPRAQKSYSRGIFSWVFFVAMTYPRSHLMDPGGGGVYHAFSRCVRRAFLCGVDAATGRDCSHRRAWIERRIHQLASTFSMSVYAYAVMHNHYHIVIQLNPEHGMQWSDEEIADRWLSLCRGARNEEQLALDKRAILQDRARINELRARLGSLSWFMRFINEPLARMANAEDECTGRFWEGRFKSQQLLDARAVLSCMAYVDLNPIRAGTADCIEESAFTSIRQRLAHPQKSSLAPFGRRGAALPFPSVTTQEYIQFVEWTRGKGPASSRITEHMQRRDWLNECSPRPGKWVRALGSMSSLKDYARRLGQRWVQSQCGTKGALS